MRSSKRSVTLLELLLVMALVGLTLGVIVTQAPKAFKTEAFERGVDQVRSRIALAQELMLNYRTDVMLSFKPDLEEKGMMCLLETGRPLPPKREKTLNRHALIKGIEAVSVPQLNFDGTLGTTPKGKLILRGANREATLTLKGFPSPVKRGKDDAPKKSQATYPQTLLSLN